MTNKLVFNGTQLPVINHNNQIWLTSKELAKALNYSSTKSVTNIYNANSDEFTSSMTMVIDSVTNGINNSLRKNQTRIFSLRGCHLIAMFSRTKVAKEFRKWVLDILDRETNEIVIESDEYITHSQERDLKIETNHCVARTKQHHELITERLCQHFNITDRSELRKSQLEEATYFLRNLTIKDIVKIVRDYKKVNIDNLKRQLSYLEAIEEYHYDMFDLYRDNLLEFLTKVSPHIAHDISTNFEKINLQIRFSLNHIRSELPRMNIGQFSSNNKTLAI